MTRCKLLKYDCRKSNNLIGCCTLVGSFVRNVGRPRGANPEASLEFGSLSALSGLIQLDSFLPSPVKGYQYKTSATCDLMTVTRRLKATSLRRVTYLLGTRPEASLQR